MIRTKTDWKVKENKVEEIIEKPIDIVGFEEYKIRLPQ